jgi:hypothetical protein
MVRHRPWPPRRAPALGCRPRRGGHASSSHPGLYEAQPLRRGNVPGWYVGGRLVLAGDDGPRHEIRVGVSVAAAAARARPEAHRPPALGAVVDDRAVGQVAVELDAMRPHRDRQDEMGEPLLHDPVQVLAVSLDGDRSHRGSPLRLWSGHRARAWCYPAAVLSWGSGWRPARPDAGPRPVEHPGGTVAASPAHCAAPPGVRVRTCIRRASGDSGAGVVAGQGVGHVRCRPGLACSRLRVQVV